MQGCHPSPTALHPLCVQGPGHVTPAEAVQGGPPLTERPLEAPRTALEGH